MQIPDQKTSQDKTATQQQPVQPDQNPQAPQNDAQQQQQQPQQQDKNKDKKKKNDKKEGQPPDYRARRIKKMKEIEKFLLEEELKEQYDFSLSADVKYLDELDYHLGDFVFQLRNPDHPDFQYNKESSLAKLLQSKNKNKQPQMRFSELSMMADLILHTDTPFESVRSENHLINLAMFRVFKRINDYVKIRNDSGQEEYNHLRKEKYDQDLNEKEFMIKYTTDNLDIFDTVPKPPKDRKKNRQYKKANMIVDDQGYANTLKNDIKIPIANKAGNGKDARVPYLKKNDQGKWVRTNNPVSDFTTLFRNYLIYKLTAQGGFKLRQFISQNGEFIYIVLYTSFENLKAAASIMGLNKTFALTQTDIFSLEPVDSKMRPLRLNHQLKLLTPDIKDGDPVKLQLQKDERDKREKIKEELMVEKFKIQLEKQMRKYKGHRFISESDYNKLIDINVESVDLDPEQIEKYIEDKVENKVNVIFEDERQGFIVKQKLLSNTIQGERKKIKKQVLKDLESIPLLQHSTYARKYVNNKGVSSSKSHVSFFETKLRILKLLFSINLKQLSFECGSNYLQPKEEMQENSEEWTQTYLAYENYLKILDGKIQQIRQRYDDKEVFEIDSYTLKQILDSKRPIDSTTLVGRKKKQEKSYIIKKIRTTPTEDPIEVYIPAANWKKYQYEHMQQDMYDAFTSALAQAKKEPYGRYLKTIWDYQNQEPQHIFSDFLYIPSSKRIKNRVLLENCWERTAININERMEVFNKMERIKITIQILVSLLDFSKLSSQEDLICSYFPLHDKYQLFGTKAHTDIFRKIILDKILVDYPNYNSYQEQVKKSDEQYKRQVNNYVMIKNLCLMPNWSSILPFNVPETEVCDYFGEKIALYFTFQSFYFKMQFSVALLSVPVFVIYEYYQQPDKGLPAQIVGLLHICLVVIWSNVFYGQWNYREVEFSLQHNMSETNDEEDIRPGFKGEYERSITSNKLNEYSYDKRLTAASERWYWILIIILLAINIVIIYALIYVMTVFDSSSVIDSGKTFIGLNILIPTIILEFIFLIEELLFKKFALFTCREANFKTNKEFEQSYATKVFTFIFFNHLVPPTLISFIIDQNIGCVQQDCAYHLQVYVRSYQYIVVVKSFFEIFYPLVQTSLSSVKNLVKQLVNKDTDQKHSYLYDQINLEIEGQAQLQNSVIDEIDIPTRDYIEMFAYFCFNVTYGFGFPLVFAITFALSFIKLAVSKRIFTKRCQRPNPQNASTIGIFKQFMNLGSSLSILTYTGVFCFTRNERPDWGPFSQLNAFMFITFFFFVIKFFIGRYYSEIDTKTQDIIKRQNFIRDNYNQKNNLSGPSAKISDPYPFFKIYGTYLEDKTSLIKKQN